MNAHYQEKKRLLEKGLPLTDIASQSPFSVSDVSIVSPSINKRLCPYCSGSGKRLAMTLAINLSGKTVRGKNTKVKCDQCEGKGFIERK